MSTHIDISYESTIPTIDVAATYLSIPKATLHTWRTRRHRALRVRRELGPVRLDGFVNNELICSPAAL